MKLLSLLRPRSSVPCPC